MSTPDSDVGMSRGRGAAAGGERELSEKHKGKGMGGVVRGNGGILHIWAQTPRVAIGRCQPQRAFCESAGLEPLGAVWTRRVSSIAPGLSSIRAWVFGHFRRSIRILIRKLEQMPFTVNLLMWILLPATKDLGLNHMQNVRLGPGPWRAITTL